MCYTWSGLLIIWLNEGRPASRYFIVVRGVGSGVQHGAGRNFPLLNGDCVHFLSGVVEHAFAQLCPKRMDNLPTCHDEYCFLHQYWFLYDKCHQYHYFRIESIGTKNGIYYFSNQKTEQYHQNRRSGKY